MLFSKWVRWRKTIVYALCREFILLPLNRRLMFIVFVARYWNNPCVPQRNFPDVFSRNPLTVIVVNCSHCRRTESRTKHQSWTTVYKRDLRRSRICLPRYFVWPFVPCTFKRSAILSDYVWPQLTKRRLGVIKWGYFTFALSWVTFRHFRWKAL